MAKIAQANKNQANKNANVLYSLPFSSLQLLCLCHSSICYTGLPEIVLNTQHGNIHNFSIIITQF